MALSALVSDINAFTDKMIVPRMSDVVYLESPLMVRLLSRNKVSFRGGTAIQIPIMYAKLNGGFFSKGDTFNTAYVQTDTAFSINMKFAHVGVTLYGTDDVTNRGPNAVFSQVESKMANASMYMAEIIAKSLYKDGQSATAGTILSTSEEFDGLLAWVDDGNDYGSYTTAGDITNSFTAIGGLTRSDLFASAPSFTGATTPDAAIFGANSYTDRAFSVFSIKGMNVAYGKAWYGNRYPDILVTGMAGWQKFYDAIQPNQRFQQENTDLAKIGFQALQFNQASVVVDKNITSSQLLLGLNTDYIEFFVSDNPKFQFGFTGFKETPNSIDIAGQYLFAGNVAVSNPRTCFKLIGAGLS